MWQGHIQATMRRGLGRHEKDFRVDELGHEPDSSFPLSSCVTLGQFGSQFSHPCNGDNNNRPNVLGC